MITLCGRPGSQLWGCSDPPTGPSKELQPVAEHTCVRLKPVFCFLLNSSACCRLHCLEETECKGEGILADTTGSNPASTAYSCETLLSPCEAQFPTLRHENPSSTHSTGLIREICEKRLVGGQEPSKCTTNAGCYDYRHSNI